MEALLAKGIEVFHGVIAALGGVVLLATSVAKLTPTKKDDDFVGSMSSKFWKAIQWLPTIGISPRTKALEEAYKEAKAELDAKAESAKPAASEAPKA